MEKNEIETALEAGAARAPSHDLPDGGKLLIVPERHKPERIHPLRPAVIKQGVVIHDRDSFSAYVNRFKTEATRIFCEPGFLAPGKAANVVAVLDYHGPKTPDNGAHTATYSPRYSEQWTRWHKACAEPMKQAEFADFIEEVRGDIHDPDAARLLDIVRTFKASKKVEFDSVVYQPSGDVRLGYDERTQQTGSSGPLPEVMYLGIPVYYRGSGYKVPVFVRYRVGNGAVGFSLKIDRAEIIEETAFAELTTAIREATLIETYLGRR
jgi:hypothetical protein